MSERTLEERVADIEKHGSLPAQHIRRRQLGAYILICIVGIIGFWQGGSQRDDIEATAEKGAQAQVGLCALRANYVEQVAQTTQLALDHPDSIFGIPTKLIVAGLERDKKVVAALAKVDC